MIRSSIADRTHSLLLICHLIYPCAVYDVQTLFVGITHAIQVNSVFLLNQPDDEQK